RLRNIFTPIISTNRPIRPPVRVLKDLARFRSGNKRASRQRGHPPANGPYVGVTPICEGQAAGPVPGSATIARPGAVRAGIEAQAATVRREFVSDRETAISCRRTRIARRRARLAARCEL